MQKELIIYFSQKFLMFESVLNLLLSTCKSFYFKDLSFLVRSISNTLWYFIKIEKIEKKEREEHKKPKDISTWIHGIYGIYGKHQNKTYVTKFSGFTSIISMRQLLICLLHIQLLMTLPHCSIICLMQKCEYNLINYKVCDWFSRSSEGNY